MPEWLRIALIIGGVLIVNIAIANFVTKREERQNRDPDKEKERAERMARQVGHLVILCAYAAVGLLVLSAGMFVFVGLIDGGNYGRVLEMAVIAGIATICYFWLNRIVRNLK